MMALDVQNVSHAFGPARVLKDVSFALAPGQFAVLLGPNGAGKTTLFSLITRLYDARQGRITVLGHDLGRESTAALARMGVLFQQTTLDLDLTVAENLRYHAALHGFSRSEGWSRAKTALARMEVLDRQHQVVRSLSGGEKRRVEIARALLHDPKILLFDEPTVGLDPASRRAILVHVRALCGEAGITVLWATHLLDEVAADDHAILLEKGAVVGNGKASDLGLGRSSDLGPDRAT